MLLKNIFDNLINNNYNIIIDQLYSFYNDINNLLLKSTNNIKFTNYDFITTLAFYNNIDIINTTDYDLVAHVLYNLIHTLIYKLADIVSHGSDEIVSSTSIFYTNKADTSYKIKLMILNFLFFDYEARNKSTKKKYYVGFDYEFNNRKIALCQVCLFTYRPSKYIWIFDPTELNKEQLNRVIDSIYISNNITKILHGSDSLDIPYMYHELFQDNKNTILQFTDKIIDTRFLCEFNKLLLKYENKKCSIYDALLYFNTINQNTYDKLQNVNKNMGPVFAINWNIHTLTQYHVKYALYDVLFLRSFVKNINKKAPIYSYSMNIIPDITKFVFLEKQNVTNLLQQINFVNNMNTYIISNYNVTLVDIYNKIVSSDVKLGKYKFGIKNILGIDYLKSSVAILIKFIVYYTICKQFAIYSNKTDKYKLNFDCIIVMDHLDKLNLKYLHNYLLLLMEYVNNTSLKEILK
jgi:hypothetical protein